MGLHTNSHLLLYRLFWITVKAASGLQPHLLIQFLEAAHRRFPDLIQDFLGRLGLVDSGFHGLFPGLLYDPGHVFAGESLHRLGAGETQYLFARDVAEALLHVGVAKRISRRVDPVAVNKLDRPWNFEVR